MITITAALLSGMNWSMRLSIVDSGWSTPRSKPDLPPIAAIHQGGGKAVLAHPYQLGFSEEHLEQTIRALKNNGLDGLECYYPRHTPKMVQNYLELARRYDLKVTAGSDFHGERVKPNHELSPTCLELVWLLGDVRKNISCI